MLVIVETKAVLQVLDEAALEAVRTAGHRVAEVSELLVDFDEGQEICAITPMQIEQGMSAVRQWLYTNVADPLFFKAQRGEVSVGDWTDAVAKIKADWAYEAGACAPVGEL